MLLLAGNANLASVETKRCNIVYLTKIFNFTLDTTVVFVSSVSLHQASNSHAMLSQVTRRSGET